MKKKIIYLLFTLMIPFCFVIAGCSNNQSNGSSGQNPTEQVEFVEVNTWSDFHGYVNARIIVNKATKVMYLVDNDGAMTVMLNPDGTPMIYQGELK